MIIFYFHSFAIIFCDSFFIKNNPDFWNELCNDLTGIFLEHIFFKSLVYRRRRTLIDYSAHFSYYLKASLLQGGLYSQQKTARWKGVKQTTQQ